MNFDLTEERQMLQDGLRRYLRENVTPRRSTPRPTAKPAIPKPSGRA